VLRFHDLRFYEPSTIVLKISILTTLDANLWTNHQGPQESIASACKGSCTWLSKK